MATPKEAPEGIVFSSVNGQIYYNDKYGDIAGSQEILGLSKSQIETMDLISEGPVQGPVSGIYIKSGVLGEIGWRSVIFSGFGVPNGFENNRWLRSFYWNEVPVLNDNAQFNFANINAKYTPGKANGEIIQVLSPFQTVSRSIGERLRAGATNAKIYRISNKDCRGVVVNVKFSSLAQYSEFGDVGRVQVDYSINYKPIFNNKINPNYIVGKNETVFGKIVAANGYIRTTRVDFLTNFLDDPGFIGWELRIERSTPESTTSKLVNASVIDSITEIQGNVYTFPNSAMVRSLFDAEFFASVPERAFDYELLKVKVPGNYDPIKKTYSGQGFATTNSGWNGEFATGKQWTDNPAWCYYDLLTNKRYGLGKYIDADLVDTTSLYQISQYCDTLVSDGYGGLEPRFTCNLWMTSREEAYKVVNDMASIFRGMTYYSNGSIYAVQDSPKNPELIFTNANVEDGNFVYSTSSRKSRSSVAVVRYNDPRDFYKPAIEYVEDFESIRKYGIRELEMSAFACTSRGQAIRLGRWALLSDKLEPETVTFVAGIGESTYLKPGSVFKIHDRNRKSKRYAGRTLSVKNIANTGSEVVIDYLIDTEPNIEYKISFLTPSFNYDPSQVTGLNSADFQNIRKSFLQEFYFSGFQSAASGNRTVINLYSGFNYSDFYVTGGQTWMMELSSRYSTYTGNLYFSNSDYDYYRTISVTEKEPHKFEIMGLQYNPQKYIEVESGLLFQKDASNLSKIPATPYNFTTNVYNIASNLKTIAYSFLVDDISNVDTYKVYARTGQNFSTNAVPDNQFLINTLPSYTTDGTHSPAQTGNFFFRVYSSNDKQGILSPGFATGSAVIYDFDPIRDVTIGALRVINITGLYSGNSTNGFISVLTDNDANPTFTWQVGSTNSFVVTGGLKYRATVRNNGDGYSRIPSSGIIYQESGLTNLQFLYSINKNINSVGGATRNYQVVIEAHDDKGKTSAGNQIGNVNESRWQNFPNGYDILSINNPRQTGIELSLSIPTKNFVSSGFVAYTGAYASTQFINPNGGVSIEYSSGRFDSDLVGGYLYISTGRFPKYETAIRSGEWATAVNRARFDFNPLSPYITSLTVADNIKGAAFAYASVSFYDEVDAALINQGVNIATGLYLSNNAIVQNNGAILKLNMGAANFYTVRVSGTATSLSDSIITSVVGNGAAIGYSTIGIEPNNYTAIFYMGAPLTGSPYTGIWGGDAASVTG